MPSYVEILDAEIDPESPVTESLMTRLRDNPIAIITGQAGAPRATSRIISPGGSAVDGALVDATDLSAAGPGFYEFLSVVLTAGKTFPWITRMRVDGDVVVTGATITINKRPLRDTTSEVIQNGVVAQLRALSGAHGVDNAGQPSASGGGGAGGFGGAGAPGFGIASNPAAIPAASWALMNRPWASRIPLVGGNGAYGNSASIDNCRGGGSLVLLVNGNVTFDTAAINADGEDATSAGSSSGNGGAGGGSIFIICNGTIHVITSLALSAKGGAGRNDGGANENGGGGGGGVLGMIASAFTGVTPTRVVTGGASGGGTSVAGTAGVDLGLITLSEEVINSLMLGAVG